MKKKKIIKQISYCIIAVCILCISVIPCYAVTGSYATARNFDAIPLYFRNVITGHFIDEPTGLEYVSENFSWGHAIAYGYWAESYEDGNTNTKISTLYFDEITNPSITNYKDYMTSSEEPSYICTGIDAFYTLNSGNYLIDTSEDEFNFKITTNVTCDYYIAATYAILSRENEEEETVQYFAINGNTANGNIEFDLCEYISTTLGYEAEVFVNALTIEWQTIDLVTNYFNSDILWYQSESVSERNANGARINYNGTIENSELTYYDTIDEAFGDMGIERYKSSFIDYTADYTSWIGDAVGGFLNMEIFPYFSIGGILLICVALGLVGYFLKVFMGG